jgi:hypothetical protein
MNTFCHSPEEVLTEAKPFEETIDLLPGVPVFLSRKETAFVLNVSLPTVDRMIYRGDLKPNEEGDLLKADLIDYMLTHTLADQPVLEEEFETTSTGTKLPL